MVSYVRDVVGDQASCRTLWKGEVPLVRSASARSTSGWSCKHTTEVWLGRSFTIVHHECGRSQCLFHYRWLVLIVHSSFHVFLTCFGLIESRQRSARPQARLGGGIEPSSHSLHGHGRLWRVRERAMLSLCRRSCQGVVRIMNRDNKDVGEWKNKWRRRQGMAWRAEQCISVVLLMNGHDGAAAQKLHVGLDKDRGLSIRLPPSRILFRPFISTSTHHRQNHDRPLSPETVHECCVSLMHARRTVYCDRATTHHVHTIESDTRDNAFEESTIGQH